LETAQRLIRAADKLINFTVGLVLMLGLFYAGYALWDAYMVYAKTGVSSEIQYYKPSGADVSNPTLPELQAINADVCAWLSVDDTNIDFPVLRGQTNTDYLNQDIYHEYALGGSIFLDCRNEKDFSDRYSLIYGHHMDGGAMFGDLANFADEEYFNEHAAGWLYLPGETYRLQFYAFLNVDAYATPMFDVELDAEGYESLLTYIQTEAMYKRDTTVTANDSIVALSTCSSATTNGRSILVAKMEEYKGAGEGQE
jgi:sortase B